MEICRIHKFTQNEKPGLVYDKKWYQISEENIYCAINIFKIIGLP